MTEFSFDSPFNEDDAATLLRQVGNISAMTFPDDATAMQTYLSFLMRVFHMRTAYISELSDGMVRVRSIMDAEGCGLPAEAAAPLHESFCQYVRASNGPVLIPDAANDPRVVDVAMRRNFNVGSYIGVPLMLSNGSLYGTLCVLDPDAHSFKATHVAVLRIIAQHIAAMIERTTRPIIQTAYQDAATDVSAILMTLDIQTMIMQAVAHDVRNPLMNIYSYIELLTDGTLGQLTIAQQEALKSILRASQFISRLTTDLAEFNQVHQRTFTLITGQIDPVVLAHNVVAAYRPQATKQELELFIEQRATMPLLLGDAERIQQVLRNLLSNALRYTPHGWVRLVIDTYDQGVEFRVEDSGVGIPAEVQAHIWERFTRGTAIGDGTGLGLYIVHELVRAMNGTVGVRSTVGEGSSFWVRLPAYGAPSTNCLDVGRWSVSVASWLVSSPASAFSSPCGRQSLILFLTTFDNKSQHSSVHLC